MLGKTHALVVVPALAARGALKEGGNGPAFSNVVASTWMPNATSRRCRDLAI
jgi:hypothetical protein